MVEKEVVRPDSGESTEKEDEEECQGLPSSPWGGYFEDGSWILGLAAFGI